MFTELTVDEISDKTKRFPIVDGPFGTQLHADEYVNEGIPVIRITNLSFAGEFLIKNLVFITQKKYEELIRSEVVENDIIIAKTGATIGKSALFSLKKGIIASSCLKVSPNTSVVNPTYLLYLITSAQGQKKIIDGATGSTRTTINIEPFKQIKFEFPNVIEQTRIAEILSAADAGIAETECLIAKYTRIKTGLMQDLLTRGIDADGNIRSRVTHKFVIKNGIEVPEDWDVQHLESLCQKISDGAHQGVKFSEQKEVPFLFVSCIKPNQILWENGSWVSFQTYSTISKGKETFRGMVLYSVVGSYGNAVTVETDKPFTFQRHIAFMIPKENILDSNFLTFYLNSEIGRRIADDLATGNAQKTITLNALRSFIITLPTLDEQQRIVTELNEVNNTIEKTKTQLRKLQSIKTGLMQDLLSGKVRIKAES